MSLADMVVYSLLGGACLAIFTTIWKYGRGLRESPRDMWLVFLYKVVEYAAYAAMNMSLILWLSRDCGLGDVAAGSYISAWSIMLSIIGMIAGSLIDTIGIKKTLLMSVVFLLVSRTCMAFITSPTLIFIVGFVPLAMGFAIVGPLVSVSIKRYSTKEGAALGFGLFYVIMNVAYAIGGTFFDWARGYFSLKDAAGKVINENAGATLLGMHFSTYQMIFLIGTCATLVSLFIGLFIREGVELTPEGKVVIVPPKQQDSAWVSIKNAAVGTWKNIRSVISERFFLIYMGLLSMTLFVRFIFFHFHYTFPKYGLRVLGEGAKIGSIYGVLNPVLIVFLVPLVASFTRKTSSYTMMVIGSFVSASSCFLAVIPAHFFNFLTNSILGELIFVKWLRMAPDMQTLMANPPVAEYWPLILFIFIFTIGESIWSPRLTQFTAEIAPKGKEGTYIALSVLPFFAAKFFVGPMSGLLVSNYTPLDTAGKAMTNYPTHYMVWVWIGCMALLSPMGLLLFRNWFIHHAGSASVAQDAVGEPSVVQASQENSEDAELTTATT